MVKTVYLMLTLEHDTHITDDQSLLLETSNIYEFMHIIINNESKDTAF